MLVLLMCEREGGITKRRGGRPDWLPDWKDVAGYPPQHRATPSEWAWEFLRRNSLYQTHYNKLLEYFKSISYADHYEIVARGQLSERVQIESKKICEKGLGEQFGIVSRFKVNCQYDEGVFPKPSMPLPDPSLSFDDANPVFIEKRPPCYYRFPNKETNRVEDFYIPEAWPISCVNDPKELCESDRDCYDANVPVSIVAEMWPKNMLFEVALDENIDFQLEQIKKAAKAQQKFFKTIEVYKETRDKHELYQGYLRAIDAYFLGVRSRDIAEYLLPGNMNHAPDYPATKTINNWIKRANELIEHDYLRLCRLPTR